VKHCDASYKGRRGLGIMWFWGWMPTCLVEHLSGAVGGGGQKATDPPDDIPQAWPRSARDLDISEGKNELIWELEWFLQSKGQRPKIPRRSGQLYSRGWSVNREI